MTLLECLSRPISDATGAPFQVRRQRGVAGGCINRAYVVEDGPQRYFVKISTSDKVAMFAAEAAGLQAIIASQALRAPQPICHGIAEGQAYLVLEFIALKNGDARSASILGEQLAAMHCVTARRYGWEIDNTIGVTQQRNAWRDDWVLFYGEQRLRYQLDRAALNNAALRDKGEALILSLPKFFASYKPQAALLHGDLWGGNWGKDARGQPVIFDPALYYGDREADLAMTELFGGFPPSFYAAYTAAYPLDAGYATRKNLYNLYHVLNHFNLFGGAYLGQATRLIEKLISER